MSKTVPEINVTGNVAVMRAALLIILDDARKVCKMDRGAVEKVCKDALSAPPRNCDVGTPGDQYYRFEDYCAKHTDLDGDDMCKGCLLEKAHDCRIAWMNLTYKENPNE